MVLPPLRILLWLFLCLPFCSSLKISHFSSWNTILGVDLLSGAGHGLEKWVPYLPRSPYRLCQVKFSAKGNVCFVWSALISELGPGKRKHGFCQYLWSQRKVFWLQSVLITAVLVQSVALRTSTVVSWQPNSISACSKSRAF